MKKILFSALSALMLSMAAHAYAANGPALPAPGPNPSPDDPLIMGPIDPFPPPPSRW